MAKFSTVTTTSGANTFQLRPRDFVESYTESNVEDIFYRATKTEVRKAIKAVDKFYRENPDLQTVETETDFYGTDLLPSVGIIDVGYDDQRNGVESHYVRPNYEHGISLGCMQFDKKTLNKLRKWATTAAATTTSKKSSKRSTRRVKAAA